MYVRCVLHVQIREGRRLQDEEGCVHKVVPTVLNSRYFIMSLLGKGGFSEVYKVILWHTYVSRKGKIDIYPFWRCTKAYDMKQYRFVACKVHQVNARWHDAKKENYIRVRAREFDVVYV
jgi:tousled-like kinase